MRSIVLVASLLVAGVSSATEAQDRCASLADPGEIRIQSSISSSMHELNMIDRASWNQRRTEAGGSGTFLIGELPVNASWDYSRFDESRRRHFEARNFFATHEESFRFFSSRMDERQATALLNCIIGTSHGLFIRFFDASDTSVSVLVEYRGVAPTTTEFTEGAIQTIGLERVSANAMDPVPAGLNSWRRTILFNRVASTDNLPSEARVTVNWGSETANDFIPRYAEPEPVSRECSLVTPVDSHQCSEGEIVSFNGMSQNLCERTIADYDRTCGIWQHGVGHCSVRGGDAVSPCPTCTGGVTYAVSCTEAEN